MRRVAAGARRAAYYPLPTAYCPPPTTYCLLPTAHCPLPNSTHFLFFCVLPIAQVDASKRWHMACGKCWETPAVAGGVVDGSGSNPHYRYGGLWKNLKKGHGAPPPAAPPAAATSAAAATAAATAAAAAATAAAAAAEGPSSSDDESVSSLLGKLGAGDAAVEGQESERTPLAVP